MSGAFTTGPRPKYPVLVIKGTTKCLAVEIGEDIMQPGTRVWVIDNVANGCLTDPSITSYECEGFDGEDAGTIVITTGYITA